MVLLLITGCKAIHNHKEERIINEKSRRPDKVLAFPEAEGFGAYSIGGRGGKVIAVTNLNDDGPGSFRAAVNAKGPRIVVFHVAGLIHLRSPLKFSEPYITIAGQTAPGDGVCLKGHGMIISDSHDVVIRNMRIRPGNINGENVQDALTIYRSNNVIVDHCSLSWSVDEVLDISDDWKEPITGPQTDNVTIQWCIISEPLNKSVHTKGEHGYAVLISAIQDGNVTVHHNLFAHANSRIPRPGGRRGYPGLRLEFTNNAIYNWGSLAGYSSDSETASQLQMSYIGNYLKPGPSTENQARRIAFASASSTKIYAAQNYMEGFAEATKDNWLLFTGKFIRTPQPDFKTNTVPESTDKAFQRVLSTAGAAYSTRDAVDLRVISEVRGGIGSIIDSQDQVNGWPIYESTKAKTDTDGDGMPDDWEDLYRFNPYDAGDGGKDQDKDGFTNVEEYLNVSSPVKYD